MKTNRPMYLGIKLSKEEDEAIIFLAEQEGLHKSSYARRILRMAINGQKKMIPPHLIKSINNQRIEA